MMLLSNAEENYLKIIYALTLEDRERINNQSIADKLAINPASVTDMLRKLDEKRLIDYSRSAGARLTRDGFKIASKTVRKHRLWETFLVEKLNFTWDEVHDIAEQLEHIQSDKLLDEIDKLLGHPKFDPHGDPIPDASGKLSRINALPLTEIPEGIKVKVVSVGDNTAAFLRYLDKQGIGLNGTLTVKEIQVFDQSVLVEVKGRKEVFLSAEACRKIFVIK
ncbi:MAG: metal-dependent transcriptional regulator [Sediminibacterium sp.]